ncbi:MAG: PhoH family protein [Bacteroidales bacterium]
MTEQTISLHTIDPIDLYGIDNEKINLIKSFFPKVKIIARGNELKLIGSKKEIEYFEVQFQGILYYVTKHHGISLAMIHDILRASGKNESLYTHEDPSNEILFFGNHGKPIKARTPNQKKLVEKQQKNDLIFAVGPAGTGKTYTAVSLAVKALKNKEVQRIILCRPAVEAEEKLGFLPGDMQEKLDPYLQPLYDALLDMMHPRKLQELLTDNVIQIAPLAYMRGRTLDNAYVILDEAQNATLNQLKMFVTRMGEHAKFIITGDLTQIDLPDKRKSGLEQCISLFSQIDGIETIYFAQKDVVRHPLVKKIITAFDTNK